MPPDPDRRDVLLGLGATALVGCTSSSEPRPTDPTQACVLAPPQVAGPFYRGEPIFRGDITEGKPGAPLTLRLRLLDASTCAPIAGLTVSVWHADALGIYSGFGGQGEDMDAGTAETTFLRGAQRTADDGVVSFETIYPGWYPGRVTHLHFRVFAEEAPLVTSQLYFPDEVTREVYALAPYASHGWRDTEDATDAVRAKEPSGDELRLAIEARGDGFAAVHDIAVRQA